MQFGGDAQTSWGQLFAGHRWVMATAACLGGLLAADPGNGTRRLCTNETFLFGYKVGDFGDATNWPTPGEIAHKSVQVRTYNPQLVSDQQYFAPLVACPGRLRAWQAPLHADPPTQQHQELAQLSRIRPLQTSLSLCGTGSSAERGCSGCLVPARRHPGIAGCRGLPFRAARRIGLLPWALFWEHGARSKAPGLAEQVGQLPDPFSLGLLSARGGLGSSCDLGNWEEL